MNLPKLNSRKIATVLFDEYHSESWTVSGQRASEMQPDRPENSSYQIAAEELSAREFITVYGDRDILPRDVISRKRLIGAEDFRRIKPKFGESAAGDAHDSQNGAETYLKGVGVRFRRSMRYAHEFMAFVKKNAPAEAAKNKERKALLKAQLEPLEAKCPNFVACLLRNSAKLETLEPGASEKEIARMEKSLKVKLPRSIRDFFKVTKHFAVEGLELYLDLIFEHPGDKAAADGKCYLCLGNYFRDADGDQILIELPVSAEPKVLYYAHSAAKKIQPLAGNWNEFLEKLTKQYLNRTFYYMG